MGFEQGDQPLSVGEFARWTGSVDKTLGVIVQGQQDHGERLARIESRQEERDRVEMLAALKQTSALKRSGVARVSATTWTTLVTTVSGVAAGILYRLGYCPAWMEKLVKP
jgi:hypothetical protein